MGYAKNVVKNKNKSANYSQYKIGIHSQYLMGTPDTQI